jgi:hypothetical protein
MVVQTSRRANHTILSRLIDQSCNVHNGGARVPGADLLTMIVKSYQERNDQPGYEWNEAHQGVYQPCPVDGNDKQFSVNCKPYIPDLSIFEFWSNPEQLNRKYQDLVSPN